MLEELTRILDLVIAVSTMGKECADRSESHRKSAETAGDPDHGLQEAKIAINYAELARTLAKCVENLFAAQSTLAERPISSVLTRPVPHIELYAYNNARETVAATRAPTG